MREGIASRQEGSETLTVKRSDLESLHRIASVGAIASSVAHEFNNILTSMLNHAKLGLRNPGMEVKQRSLEKLLVSSQRAAKITTGILALSRNRSARKEPADPVALVVDVLTILQKDFSSHHVSVERDFHETPPIAAVPAQIEQVLMNLLINARQAIGERGLVCVGVRQNPETGMVEISVSDSGLGIAPEVLHKIFDPFFTTKEGPDETGNGGTGLGLCICREIIARHDGRLRVESTPGSGTKVIIKLPCAARESHAA